MDDARLPAKIEVSGLIRVTQSHGGFGMVLHKGEETGGTILVVILDNQGLGVLYERMPALDGTRKWTRIQAQVADNKSEFEDYLQRRIRQDPDVWIVELTIAEGERLVLNAS